MNPLHVSVRAVLFRLMLGGLVLYVPPSLAAGDKPAAEAVAITSAKVLQQSMPIYQVGIGTVVANASVTVRSRLDGVLKSVAFTEGQDVRAGQKLAQLDDRALRAQAAQVEAQLAKSRALLANARLDEQRQAMLMQENAISQQALDTQRALVAQLAAQVQSDQAQVAYAKVQLDYTQITSPIAGRTGALMIHAGNLIRANDANGLVVINQLDPIVVQFNLPAESVAAIAAAQQRQRKIQARVYAQNDETLTTPLATGELVLLNNQIDASTGSVLLKARFANQQHQLWPGQFVQVKLLYGQREQVLTIAETAIQKGSAGTFVYAIDEKDQVQAKPVTLIGTQSGVAMIAKGINVGERVVIAGQYKLRPGVTVKEVSQDNPKAPGKANSQPSTAKH